MPPSTRDDMANDSATTIVELTKRIFEVRGRRVMVDSDLAALYGVSTRRLNEQVKRNRDRFPEDFMFRLTAPEKAEVVANCDHLQKLKLMAPPERPRKPIGFSPRNKG